MSKKNTLTLDSNNLGVKPIRIGLTLCQEDIEAIIMGSGLLPEGYGIEELEVCPQYGHRIELTAARKDFLD